MDVNKTTKALETLAKGKAWSVDSTQVYWQDSGSPPTQSEIDAQIAKDDAAYNAAKYQRDREFQYPTVVDQLDDIYHNGIDAWKATIKAVKDKYPKS